MDKHVLLYNFKNKLMFIICTCCLLNGISLSANISRLSKLKQARQLFYQSVENRRTIDKAITLFKEIGKNKEYEGVASTYIGALTALKGKFAFFPITKYRHVMKGLKLMDQGILKSPNNIEARFIRGMTCYHLPFFFKRKETARKDFKMIVKRLNTDYRQYDSQMIMNVTNFLLENAELDAEEREIVKKIQNVIKKNDNFSATEIELNDI